MKRISADTGGSRTDLTVRMIFKGVRVTVNGLWFEWLEGTGATQRNKIPENSQDPEPPKSSR